MKKYLLLATILFGLGVSASFADSRSIPTADSGGFMTSDYGGVNYSTISFSSASIMCFSGPGVLEGIMVSSADFVTPAAFVMFRDTGSLTLGTSDYATHAEVFSVFLASGSFTQAAIGSTGGGMSNFIWKPAFPIYFRRGLSVKLSNAVTRWTAVLWTKHGK